MLVLFCLVKSFDLRTRRYGTKDTIPEALKRITHKMKKNCLTMYRTVDGMEGASMIIIVTNHGDFFMVGILLPPFPYTMRL